jgi:hypothetical protein
VTVRDKLGKIQEKVAALIHRRMRTVEETKFKFTVREKTVSVEMPEEAFYLEGVQVAKRGVAMDIQKFFPKITNVKFTENFKAEPKTVEETKS